MVSSLRGLNPAVKAVRHTFIESSLNWAVETLRSGSTGPPGSQFK